MASGMWLPAYRKESCLTLALVGQSPGHSPRPPEAIDTRAVQLEHYRGSHIRKFRRL